MGCLHPTQIALVHISWTTLWWQTQLHLCVCVRTCVYIYVCVSEWVQGGCELISFPCNNCGDGGYTHRLVLCSSESVLLGSRGCGACFWGKDWRARKVHRGQILVSQNYGRKSISSIVLSKEKPWICPITWMAFSAGNAFPVRTTSACLHAFSSHLCVQ